MTSNIDDAQPGIKTVDAANNNQNRTPRWWVNQGTSYRQERDGSYIWAPQVTKAGHAVAHHKAVFAVRTGDVIIHYADGHIRAVGVALTDGHESKRPAELPDAPWQEDGYRADVEYSELEAPLPLSAIDAELRIQGGGPFTSGGSVQQGYLFGLEPVLADRMRGLLSEATETATGRLWAVYIGNNSESNLRYSLPLGRWGWKRTQPYYNQLEPGDDFVIASGYTGGSPRVSAEEFLQHSVRRVISCTSTSEIYQDSTPFWPDEDTDISYPYRVDIEVVDEAPETLTNELDSKFGGPVAEAIRRSAISQGRAELVETTGSMTRTSRSIEEVVVAFSEATRAAGLDYGSRHETLLRSFVAALATKPFAILTGLSGSGKTRLAQAFGDWIGAVRVVAVRPDWTSPDALFGFENALSEAVDGRHAWNVPDTLRFILRARDNPAQPHLLLLDEMNLAHVERYFADVLSGMESREPVIPDLLADGDGFFRLRLGSSGHTPIPENLFVVGTVNIDETTYMFSPKVLDRANTFEFRVETTDLVTTSAPSRVQAADPDLVEGFLDLAISRQIPVDDAFANWMRKVHELLTVHNREFGHRTFQEALSFAVVLRKAGEQDPMVALDLQIAQKVLPRLHGSRRELSPLLNQLGGFCFNGPEGEAPDGFDCATKAPSTPGIVLPISYDKLHRMAKRLQENHFVSFAE